MGAGNNVVTFANYPKRDFEAVVTINGQLVKENEELKAENEKLKKLLKRFTDLNKQQLEEKPKTKGERMVNESNYQKVYLSIIATCLLFFTIALTGFGIQTYRLESTRQQLKHVRMELTAAQDRQYELATILRRDSEILSESSSTIAGIRSQIAVIRESYEEMEKLLYSGFLSSRSRRNSNLVEQ